MTPEFWHQRWQRGEIGWHSDEINPHLSEHWPRLAVPVATRVFVPLCGKTRDLLWLAGEGYRVLGNEISPIAVDDFVTEHGLTASRVTEPPFERVVAAEIELLVGDFFDLTPAHLTGVGAVYDRASLIALPPAERPRYARALAALLPVGVPTLLVTYDYDQTEMSGPPFAVGEAEVRRLFGADFDVQRVAVVDVLAEHPGFVARGLTALTEQVYVLRPRRV